MLCEPVAEDRDPPEAPVVKFSKALLRELAETFDSKCSLLYLATPEGFGLVAKEYGHLLTEFARSQISLGVRTALDSGTQAAFVLPPSDEPAGRQVLAPLCAVMLGLLRIDNEIVGFVYLDRPIRLGMYVERHLSQLEQLLQARASRLARLLREKPDFGHLGLLSSDLKEVG
ncbi:MAG: hypothetical protein U0931_13300 [Vulcanimicrobiota bacterium]